MIKNYSHNKQFSNGVSFILRAAKKRRTIAMEKSNEVKLELGMRPMLAAIK